MWRPENWQYKYEGVGVFRNLTFLNPSNAFEEGADIMLIAIISRLHKHLSYEKLAELLDANYYEFYDSIEEEEQ